MARPLRVEYAGAYYHVMNRGNQRRQVFFDTDDYELFLGRLGEFAEKFSVRVLCYCCMPNHFHIYLQTVEPNLSRFMQSFLTSFTVTMNRRKKSSGHLFQGRFRAELVENSVYRDVLSRYIHLNPVRITRYKSVSVQERRSVLRSWRWSSYPAAIGIGPGTEWYGVRDLLDSAWGRTLKERMKRYRRYVEEELLKDIGNPFENIIAQSILGSDSFIDRIKREYLLALVPKDEREQRELVRMRQPLSFDDVVEVVSGHFGVGPEQLFDRKDSDRRARRMLMYSVCKYCRGGHSLSEMARHFSITLSGLTGSRDRFENDIRTDGRLRREWMKIDEKLIKRCKK